VLEEGLEHAERPVDLRIRLKNKQAKRRDQQCKRWKSLSDQLDCICCKLQRVSNERVKGERYKFDQTHPFPSTAVLQD
jgi:hypothetical protein